MKYFKTMLILALFTLLFIQTSQAQAGDENKIQMAILLDTSNSMDGLISQAKSQLWKIVNEFALSKKNNKSPVLEVALFEYGNDSLAREEGHIRMVVPLTQDLDKISEELFNLVTNGGDEYCGQVIQKAAANLKWTANNGAYKVIFIAGNEPFNQGNTDYKKSCKDTIKKGIIVNTIFCGTKQEGIQTFWKDGADLADGSYMNIDQEVQAVYIKAPQDEEILKLNDELNKTYIGYGTEGKEKKEIQAQQDTNASAMAPESAVQRTVTKSSALYSNAGWDIVDAVNEKAIDLNTVKDSELPLEMQKMSKEERVKYINDLNAKRELIQKKIADLNEERKEYIANEMKKNSNKNTLDNAIINAVREQSKKKSFTFE